MQIALAWLLASDSWLLFNVSLIHINNILCFDSSLTQAFYAVPRSRPAPMAEFLLMPFGSAGDTFPFIGLGQHLQQRGHTVRIASNGYFRSHIKDAGLPFDELWSKQDYLDNLNNPDIWHPTRGFKAIVGHPKMAEMVEEQHVYIIEQFNRNPNIVIVAGSLVFGARIARETHGLKMATIHLSPSVLLSAIKPPRLPNMKIPSWSPRSMVRLLYWMGNRMVINPTMQQVVGKYRKELRLPRIKNYFKDWIHSTELVLGLWPDWFAEPVSDWPKNTILTGFPFFDSTSTSPLSPSAMEFVKAGSPPIVATFGSAMKFGEPLFKATIDACTTLNQRAILLTPFAEQVPIPLPPTIRRFDYLPLSKLLPHAAALVHHGGIGTSAQALRAGVPQVITPLAHDQFDNAERVQALGVSTTVPGAKINASRLSKGISQAVNQLDMREKALEQSRHFLDQNPFGTLVESLEKYAARMPSTKYWV
jgi:rhamnosyltransferase subunit B